jgi:hypothetical protein
MDVEQNLYPSYCRHGQPIYYTEFCIGCRDEKRHSADLLYQKWLKKMYNIKYRHFNFDSFFGMESPDDDDSIDIDDDIKVLGLKKTSSEEDLKKAFRQKARETHPDKVGGNGDCFKRIRKAYENLMKRWAV